MHRQQFHYLFFRLYAGLLCLFRLYLDKYIPVLQQKSQNVTKKIRLVLRNIQQQISIEKTSSDKNTSNVSIVTQNEKKEIMQIIYFDFDNSKLSEVSKSVLLNFLDKNKNSLSRYIILGHTDTMGSETYNISLSIKRAEAVKDILLKEGIKEKTITILGKGEEKTAVRTPDETKHPANRRAEVKILN